MSIILMNSELLTLKVSDYFYRKDKFTRKWEMLNMLH